MANLYELERQRLKLYGEMLKSDVEEKRVQQRKQRQALQKRDSLQLEQHIENTKRYDELKRIESRELNNALRQDNLTLTSIKKNASFTAVPDHAPNFISQIHELDGQRVAKLKNERGQQQQENRDFTQGRRSLEERTRELERAQAERHAARVREQQMESVRSYQEIKRKHQQDMSLYDKHRRLVELNDTHRDQVESFTHSPQGTGLLDRYNRNEYLQRRASLRENQEQVVRQMEELDLRRSQQAIEYKRKTGDLEDSMLASVLSKPPRYEPRAYSNDLRSQMEHDSLRRLEEESAKKERVEISGVFGGVHCSERQRMMQIIDKRLGIDRYMQQKRDRTAANDMPEGQVFKYG